MAHQTIENRQRAAVFHQNLISLAGSIILAAMLWQHCAPAADEQSNTEPASAPTDAASNQKLPPAQLPASLIPAGYRIQTEVSGDLNKDEIADKVVVFFHKSEPTEPGATAIDPDAEPPRLLVVFLARDGQYHKAIESQTAIMCRQCGGIMGDPYQAVKIERGSFLISHFGGSRERWGFDHRFQLRSGRWQMTGVTETTYDSATGAEQVIDTNLLTGDQITSTKDEQGHSRQTRAKVQPSLRLLKDFNVG
ncbi:MAG: hypothetical protein KDK39_12640 [Leptospiraceae bacterium]|nr:hypothetical protein [Leptospiraceae bacterium]